MRIGDSMTLKESPDMEKLGNAVHAFMAADRAEYASADRQEMAKAILDSWDVLPALKPDQLVKAGDNLIA